MWKKDPWNVKVEVEVEDLFSFIWGEKKTKKNGPIYEDLLL